MGMGVRPERNEHCHSPTFHIPVVFGLRRMSFGRVLGSFQSLFLQSVILVGLARREPVPGVRGWLHGVRPVGGRQ